LFSWCKGKSSSFPETNIAPENDGLEDYFPLPGLFSHQVLCYIIVGVVAPDNIPHNPKKHHLNLITNFPGIFFNHSCEECTCRQEKGKNPSGKELSREIGVFFPSKTVPNDPPEPLKK